MKLEGLDHIALAVRDVERSVRWYVEVLGLERQHEGAWDGVPKFVGRGATGIALFPLRAPENSLGQGSPIRVLHFALRADRENFQRAQNELQAREVDFHFEDHGIAHSIYFCDPDGHKLEITTYEVQ
ncbi:MAG TPA: VOC family protein [Chthoniobacterales bacterium]|nr:VOC family protein [Chthoniobacterales bacterium]